MISWEDFNYINKGNLKEAFEDMCRMFFNYYYFIMTLLTIIEYNSVIS